MTRAIAVLNAGSSSIKFALYDQPTPQGLRFRGKIEGIGTAPVLTVADAGGRQVKGHAWPVEGFDHAAATREVIQVGLDLLGPGQVATVGHRVVHGGAVFAEPVRITPEVIDTLATLIPLAPLHQPHNLAPIRTIAEAAPHVKQVACFDTAFHYGQPHLAQAFALPRAITDEGVRRYGFHGLSYEYVVSRLPETAPELAKARVIVAHLGNGASLCAVRNGRSVATTMGFTAVEGLMMGTRCGTLDPGVLIHLMDTKGYDARTLEDLVYKRSGLLGVSGISSDMRTLRASTDPKATEAIALFGYRVVREIGSLAAALGGVDAVVFTGGIGENDAQLRAEVGEGCAWLGLALDPARNAQGGPRISRDGSAVSAWVVATDEELMIARHAARVVGLEAAA